MEAWQIWHTIGLTVGLLVGYFADPYFGALAIIIYAACFEASRVDEKFKIRRKRSRK